jgi:hypothetical protein
LKDGFARLDPEHVLFKKLIKEQPGWWQNICKNKSIYIDVRKDNSLDVYYNGGKIIDLSYTNNFQGSIHFKYIPIKSRNNYVPFLFSEGKIRVDKDKLDFIDLDNFSPEIISEIQKLVSNYYPANSEKGIQAELVLKNSYFIDSEFQFDHKEKDIRFDLVWVDIGLRKLFVVELKTTKDTRLYFDERSRDNKIYNKIDSQLSEYRDFIKEHKLDLFEYYQKVFIIKKRLQILPEGFSELNSLDDFEFEEKPILLVGDCTQNWIKENSERIDAKLQGIAYACFYQGEKTRTFRIPPKNQGNKHILS